MKKNIQRKKGARIFLQWWQSILNDLKEESKNICNNDNNNIITNINYILLKIALYPMNCIKSSLEELKY